MHHAAGMTQLFDMGDTPRSFAHAAFSCVSDYLVLFSKMLDCHHGVEHMQRGRELSASFCAAVSPGERPYRSSTGWGDQIDPVATILWPLDACTTVARAGHLSV
jgi:hypothetical protein